MREVLGAYRHHCRAHGISTRAYKLKHGLRSHSSLLAPSVRARLVGDIDRARAVPGFEEIRKRGLLRAHELNAAARAAARAEGRPAPCSMSPETSNRNNHCVAQIIRKIRTIAAAIGATPR